MVLLQFHQERNERLSLGQITVGRLAEGVGLHRVDVAHRIGGDLGGHAAVSVDALRPDNLVFIVLCVNDGKSARCFCLFTVKIDSLVDLRQGGQLLLEKASIAKQRRYTVVEYLFVVAYLFALPFQEIVLAPHLRLKVIERLLAQCVVLTLDDGAILRVVGQNLVDTGIKRRPHDSDHQKPCFGTSWRSSRDPNSPCIGRASGIASRENRCAAYPGK